MKTVMDDTGAALGVEAVYRSIHPALWRALYSYTADREIASDSESEAFAQALRARTEIVDVAAWVWRTAFLIAAGMMAARPRANPLSARSDQPADPVGSIAEFIGLLGGLSDQQRACVVLRHVGGLDTSAIATALNTTTTTVRVQLHRAHGSLRRSLKEAEHG